MLGTCNCGSAVNNRSAILRVTCSAGATVTAAKGGVTLRPAVWTQADNANRETALFFISPQHFDAVNPWTVTATKNGQTKTASVTISTAAEYEVAVTFELYLIRNGLFTAEATHGTAGYANAVLAEDAGGYVEFTVPASDNTNATLYFSSVDRSQYSYLVFDGQYRGYMAAYGVLTSLSVTGATPSTLSPRVGLPDISGAYSERATSSLTLGTTDASIPIAAQIAGSSSDSRAGGLRVYNLYLSASQPSI